MPVYAGRNTHMQVDAPARSNLLTCQANLLRVARQKQICVWPSFAPGVSIIGLARCVCLSNHSPQFNPVTYALNISPSVLPVLILATTSAFPHIFSRTFQDLRVRYRTAAPKAEQSSDKTSATTTHRPRAQRRRRRRGPGPLLNARGHVQTFNIRTGMLSRSGAES